MNNYERIIWILFSALLILLYLNERQEVNDINEWVSKQNEELVKLDSLISSVENNSNTDLIANTHSDWVFDSELRYLEEQGLTNPIAQLKEDLTKRDDLIPSEGVLGGTMRVYSTDQIRILPGRYVYAVFEDGHNQGSIILQYEVKDGQINWEIVESSLF
jgi:hypothetical protein